MPSLDRRRGGYGEEREKERMGELERGGIHRRRCEEKKERGRKEEGKG